MTPAQLQQTAVSWVHRARSGDQVAMAALMKAGQDARRPGARPEVRFVYEAAKKYIETHPVKKLSAERRRLGTIPEMSAEDPTPVSLDHITSLRKKRRDTGKPVLPRGALHGIFDPEKLQTVVLGASRYQNGIDACALVLASGPPLNEQIVHEIGASQFASDSKSSAFMQGVQFSGEEDAVEAVQTLPQDLHPALIIGQCVGRACRLQALRQPGSAVSDYDPVVGWELGE